MTMMPISVSSSDTPPLPARHGGEVRIAHCGDPQLGFSRPRTEEGYQEDLARFERLVEDVNDWGPDLCFLAGDLTHDLTMLERDWPRLLRAFRVPVLVAPGNHDMGGGVTRETVERFVRVVGYERRSVKIGGWRFLCGNSQYRFPTDDTELAVRYETWFWRELDAAKAAGEPVLLGAHIPPFTVCADEPDGYWNFPQKGRIERLDAYVEHGARFFLAGHTHKLLATAYRGMTILAPETTCRNFDGLPPGYRRLVLRPDGGYDWSFQPVGASATPAQ